MRRRRRPRAGHWLSTLRRTASRSPRRASGTRAEGRLTGDQARGDGAQVPLVGERGGLFVVRPLGGQPADVGDGPGGTPEAEDPQAPIGADQHPVGGEIAVEAVAVVHPLQRLGELEHDVEQRGRAHGHHVVASLLDDGGQRGAVHVGEREGAEALVEGDGLGNPGVVDGLEHLELLVQRLALVAGGVGRQQTNQHLVRLTAGHARTGAEVPEAGLRNLRLAHDFERPHTESDGGHASPDSARDHSTAGSCR